MNPRRIGVSEVGRRIRLNVGGRQFDRPRKFLDPSIPVLHHLLKLRGEHLGRVRPAPAVEIVIRNPHMVALYPVFSA